MITNFAHVLGALIFMQLFAGIVRGMRLDFDPTKMPLPSTAAWAVLVAFRFLWDSINASRGPWSSNPFVWCISFRRLGTAR